MKFHKDLLEKKWVSYTIAACSGVLLYLLLTHLPQLWSVISHFLGYISPVITGAVIAVVLNPVMRFFQNDVMGKMKKRLVAKTLSVFFTTLVVILVVALLMVALIPRLVNNIVILLSNWSTYADSIQGFLDSTAQMAAEYDLDLSGIAIFGDDMLATITRKIPDNVGNIVNTSYSIGKGFFNGVISFILAIYFLMDKERLKASFKMFLTAVLPKRWNEDFLNFSRKCYIILNRYVGGALFDALIVGVANFIFMTVAGMPFSLLVSVIVAITNLAPTFGPVVGGIIGAAILLLMNPWYAVWFVIFTLILQLIDGYVIKPKLFGDTFGVPSVWILIMIIVGGRMFGFWGIMLAIPFTAVLAYIYDTFIKKRIQKEKL